MKAIITSKAVFPGLYGQGINPEDNTPNNTYVTWGGGSDSFFEYLLKYAQLIGSTETYLPTWIESVRSSILHLVTRPGGTEADVLFLSDYNRQKIPKYSHLGCFAPGNWILGGRILENTGIFGYGLRLAAGCMHTYTSTVTGIGPESFAFRTASGGTNRVSIYDEDFYRKNGFNYRAVDYVLRPEVLESAFYAYRTTGDFRWQDLAWDAFQNIQTYCKAPAALAGIMAVNKTDTAQYDDSESFLYAGERHALQRDTERDS
jgi:mannosyl-oligosaccharide alpha-1,2-mannosidase